MQIVAILAVGIIFASQSAFTIDPFIALLIGNIFALGVVSCLVYIAFFIRCPECQKPVGLPFVLSTLQPSGKWINRDWGLNFCPSCGADYQKETEREKLQQ